MHGPLYVFLCLAVPFVWGVAAAYAFDAIAARRRSRPQPAPPTAIESGDMYEI